MKSTGRQGFATWVYRALMPTVYDRWNITNCRDHWNDDDDNVGSLGKSLCGQLGAQLGVIGGGQSFITLSSRIRANVFRATGLGSGAIGAAYSDPANDLIGRIWAQPSDDCIYQPGMPETAWTFSCSGGVDETTSVGANTWGFPSWSGNPEPNPNSPDAAQQAIAAQVRARPPITLGRARHGSRRAVGGPRDLAPRSAFRPACGSRVRPSKWTGCCSSTGGTGRSPRAPPWPCAAAAHAHTETQGHRALQRGGDFGSPARAGRAAPAAWPRLARAGDQRPAAVPRAAGLPRPARADRAGERAVASAVAAGHRRRPHAPSRPAGASRALRA